MGEGDGNFGGEDQDLKNVGRGRILSFWELYTALDEGRGGVDGGGEGGAQGEEAATAEAGKGIYYMMIYIFRGGYRIFPGGEHRHELTKNLESASIHIFLFSKYI